MKTQLLNCHACGHQVSAQAESCPKCAQPFRVGNKTSVAKGVFWGLFSFFILLPLGCVAAVMLFGAFAAAFERAAKAKEEAIARQQENDARRAADEKSRAETKALIEEAKAKVEFEQTPEGIAAKEKEEAEQRKIAQENERLRIAHEQAMEEERMRPYRERAAKILAYQMQQASNGFPSFQITLGKRYLTGDGVETNLALAKHWLQSAATNGEPIATNLLSRLQ